MMLTTKDLDLAGAARTTKAGTQAVLQSTKAIANLIDEANLPG
jgi:hypothetical protein